MAKTRNVLALANLVRIGIERGSIFRVLRRWCRYQQSLSPAAIAAGRVDLRYSTAGPLVDPEASTLFMSAHFGPYFVLIKALAEASRDRVLYICVGEQSEDHTAHMVALAKAHDLTLRFITGGFALIRGIRRAQREKAPIFVLIDVPWGASTPVDSTEPFLGGTLKTRTALFRMAEHLGLRHDFLLAHPTPDGAAIVSHGPIDQSMCIKSLDAAVRAHPHLYDRLFDLHRYHVAPATGSAVRFRFDGGYYLFEIDSSKTFKLPAPQRHDRHTATTPGQDGGERRPTLSTNHRGIARPAESNPVPVPRP